MAAHRWKLPHLTSRFQTGIRWIGFLFILFTLLRFLFSLVFYSEAPNFTTINYLQAMYLGAKFDMRVTLVLLAPYILWSTFAPRKKGYFPALLWRVYNFFIMNLIFLIFATDFGYYAYLNDRVNASVIEFLKNPIISIGMVWSSYPITPGFFVYLLFLFTTSRIFSKFITPNESIMTISPSATPAPTSKWVRAFLVALYIFGLYGKVDYYPLRWSDGFFSSNRFISALSQNPIHYFFDTFSNREKNYDVKLVKKYYPYMVKYLDIKNPDPEKLNFTRIQKPTPLPELKDVTKPNVIVFIMESLSAHRMGVFGNPTQATPHLDQAAENGWLFTHFYTPTEGTARGVFAVVSGVADINKNRTSSRNPLIVSQNTAANVFKTYDKFYFIGGSANWGNIRGLLENNIKDLNLMEESKYELPRTDVWGLSDYDLFIEANRHLKQHNPDKPFFAIIQSASFHRPYTIPERRGDFKISPDSMENEVMKWGFSSLKEYDSLRFADFSFGNFIKIASHEDYFKNTLILVLGDHGLPDLKAKNLTSSQIHFSTERFHVPLIMYMPQYLKPKKFEHMGSQVDVLPTVAAITGHTFINTGLGRNLFAPSTAATPYVMSYVYYTNPHQIFAFTKNEFVTGLPEKVDKMFSFSDNKSEPEDIHTKFSEEFEKLQESANAIYQTSKYLLYHNKAPRK